MSTSARQVAGELRRILGDDLRPLKMHKLLYLCQGHHLAAFGRPLFPDVIKAYDHGPVVSELEGFERRFGSSPAEPTADEAVLNTVSYVVSRYGNLSGSDLRGLTHSQSPWIDADQRRQEGGSDRIEQDAIRDYFRHEELAAEDDVPGLSRRQIDLMLTGAEDRLGEPVRETTPADIRAWAASGV